MVVDISPTEILYKYCRKYKSSGRPMRCSPSHMEEVYRDTNRIKHSKRKLIYDNLQLAEQCAQELTEKLGWVAQRAYPCPRSKHGHYHLTKRLED